MRSNSAARCRRDRDHRVRDLRPPCPWRDRWVGLIHGVHPDCRNPNLDLGRPRACLSVRQHGPPCRARPLCDGGLTHVPDHAFKTRPQLPGQPHQRRRLCAEGNGPCLAGRRGLCAARCLGLRQDHASEHHLGPRAPVAGPRAFWRPRRDRCRDDRTQHRPGVPVPRRLRHDDRARQPRLPLAQPGDGPRLHRQAAWTRSPR